ncbi:unnamed protein product [Bemisia tabaci]|uniref:Hexosyltransferase n=1 Tax=Bemisia tabaci TaxID=7038 RepID=A0A9P0G2H1_BEMTA|nr:PREDICTED: chondroitin sulfate synthase 1-like [Bemisia tabaci]XP_018912064.1 PREDICTED: chondroitin sulfate synthase 1-like [Bemisia tabaci]CAH0754363.1 unnamed protein product [Bemisia tabaci]
MTRRYECPKSELTLSGSVTRRKHRAFRNSARRRRCLSTTLGVVAGFIVGLLLLAAGRQRLIHLDDRIICHNRRSSVDDLMIDASPVDLNVNSEYKGLVFVGVMTAQKYLSTRAVAVYDTWGREVAGKIAFFASQVSHPPPSHPHLPLVPLKGVDDSYPPQKKSFLMLQYMFENFGDRFEWFMRADDDLYVHPEKLAAFLRSVDSSKSYYIGQAGRGNQKEFGLLSLEYDENFCMGGPGVILSRATLAKIAPHTKECLQNLYTTHEDVELGRCVRKYAGIPCTWSYEMQTILYHNSSGKEAFTGNLKRKEVHRAITLHPVKQHNHMYRVHNYMKSLKIHALQQKTVILNRDIVNMAIALHYSAETASKIHLGKNMTLFELEYESLYAHELPQHFGMTPGLNKFKPTETSDVLMWDFLARSLYSDSSINPRKKIHSALREGLEDVIREVMESINKHSKQRGRVIEFRELLYGYHRVNPLFGADYVLDMLLMYKKYRGRKMTVPVRRHAYLQQQFTGLEIREIELDLTLEGWHEDRPSERLIEDDVNFNVKRPKKAMTKFPETAETSDLIIVSPNSEPVTFDQVQFLRQQHINFILPLSGRFPTFRRFVHTFEEVCLKEKESASLYVMLFPSDVDNSVNETLSLVQEVQRRYPRAKIVVYPIFAGFTRALALDEGARLVPGDGLLFFIDVDMTFTRETLARVRLNTIRARSVYFPIVFSEFDPEVAFLFAPGNQDQDKDRVTVNSGYWRQFGFGIASLFKSDYFRVGGLDTKIKGWGKEDVDLYTKFILCSTSISVFRAVDPGLFHRFHIITCSPKLDDAQLKMCKDTRFETYGSVPYLSSILVSNLTGYINFANSRQRISSLS